MLLYLASKLFKLWSKFTLLLICLLVSRGQCISRDLHLRDVIQSALMIAPFLFVCLCLEVWGEYDESRKYTTNFIYCTWVGGVLVFFDLFLFAAYVKNLLRTYQDEAAPEKKAFYRTWGPVYSSAFLSLPIATVVANLVASHVRVKVMFLFSNTVLSVLLGLLVIGLWPERTNTAFCIDKNMDLACSYGNQAGSLLDEELKTG